METLLTSPADLDRAAARFIDDNADGATVALSGDLGAGKTTFVRRVVAELARRAGIPAPRVTSPTFVLHQSYPDLPRPVEHFDLYRLERVTGAALVELGYYEALERRRAGRGFLFVEWPERVEERRLLRLDRRLELAFRGTDRLLRQLEQEDAKPEK